MDCEVATEKLGSAQSKLSNDTQTLALGRPAWYTKWVQNLSQNNKMKNKQTKFSSPSRYVMKKMKSMCQSTTAVLVRNRSP